MKPSSECQGLVPCQRRWTAAAVMLLLGSGLFLCLRPDGQPSVRPAIAEKSVVAPTPPASLISRPPAPPVVRTMVEMTPPPGAKSDYPLGVNPEPPPGKVILTSDTPKRLAFPSASAGSILPARVRLLELPDGKYRRLRTEEVWVNRDRTELIARHTMVGDHLLVSPADGVDASRLRAALPAGFAIRRVLRSGGALLISFPVENADSLPAARQALEKLGPSLVKRAEPDTFVHTAAIPNDPFFPQQWGLHNTGQNGGTSDADVDGPEAWDLRTDATGFPIAVIDTGIYYTFTDLGPNIWRNAGERGPDATGRDKGSNRVDDDGNGYVDDWGGWDFANDDNNPMDDNGHGTHVAGIIGARGNDGNGIAGVCWSCRMMPLKALTASGGGAWSDIIEAVAYAKAMGARVGNLSFGAYGAAPEEVKAVFESANETLWCAAAGNGELPYNGNQTGDDLDEFHFFPACLDIGHLISVTATDRNDRLATFANYGRFTVDIAAPGVSIYSTTILGSPLKSGTSMATAYVTGFCALAYALRDQPYPINIRQLVLTTVKRSEALRNKVGTRGRLDAALFLTMARAKMKWEMFAWGCPTDEQGGYCLQIRPDGTVVAWGDKATATGSTRQYPAETLAIPVEVPLPADARSVETGGRGECYAVLSNGTVWTWGEGTAPHALQISNVRFLNLGGSRALRTDGSVWTWRGDWRTNGPSGNIPGPISFNGRIVQMTSTSFLDDTGRLHSRWVDPGAGLNMNGHDATGLPLPVEGFPPVDRFTEIIHRSGWNYAIVLGTGAILARTASGEAWGVGSKVTLGLPYDPLAPAAAVSATPVRLPHWDGYLNAWPNADGGIYGTMPDGRVVYSGWPYPHALGINPAPPHAASPLYEVGGITHLVDFTEQAEDDGWHYALDQFGKVFQWDIRGYQLPGTNPCYRIPELSTYEIAGLRLTHSEFDGIMLLESDFRGIYYGSNYAGLAGIGFAGLQTRPIELMGLRGARDYSGGDFAVMADGLLHAWDGGRDILLPTPTPAGRVIRHAYRSPGFPIQFLIMEDGTLWQVQYDPDLHLPVGYTQVPTSAPALRFVREARGALARVLLADGTMIEWQWGAEWDTGQFVVVTDGFIAFSEYWQPSAAVKEDGTVWIWQGDGYSQEPGFAGITQIAGQYKDNLELERSFLALRDDGRVLFMDSMASPVLVEGLTDIAQVAAGPDHFVALRADGALFTWGNNDTGQLGTGDTAPSLQLEQPYGMSGVVAIWTYGKTTIAKRSDGSFWGWGGEYLPWGPGSKIYGAPNLAYGFSGTVFNAGNGFEDWLTTYFNETELRDIELFADVKDPDDDGLTNLVEYALGTNPRKRTVELAYSDQPLPEPTPTLEYTRFVPSARLEKVRRNYYSNGVGIAGAGTPDVETSHLVMTVPRAERRSDVDYIVEVSDDMKQWHFGPGHTVEVLNTLTNLVVYDARPFEESRRRFIRLRLVRNNPGQTSIPR